MHSHDHNAHFLTIVNFIKDKTTIQERCEHRRKKSDCRNYLFWYNHKDQYGRRQAFSIIGICHENGFYWNILGIKNAFIIITKISRLYNKPFLGRCQITLVVNSSRLDLVVVWLISSIKQKPTHDKAHAQR